MTPHPHGLSPEPIDLKPLCGLPGTDIPDQVERALSQAPGYVWEPSTISRETYLDLAEVLVSAAAVWQDKQGATIDPFAGRELGQTSPRFASSAAVLLSLGRIPELREQVFLSMDWCCARLNAGQAASPDFWLRELMTAWWALEDVEVPEARRARWREMLTGVDSERHNQFVEGPDKPIETLHNWVVYAAAGEGMREIAGLIPEGRPFLCGNAFWEKYMRVQLRHFSANGMYRDPNDPLTYDMTTRLQVAVPLMYGLETPLRPVYEELLRRGALAQLLYVSPNGLAPFGGRSNSFHLQECILAALGEIEARRYRTARPALAGAFKRQAHLGVAAMERWLRARPHRHLKNMFPPETRHGCEAYAGYAVYSLFAASCLVLAAQFADESIPEAPMPAELGGYVVAFAPAFHKVFAACGGTQVEIDTAADLNYDATGLGRLLHRGLPPELALAMPIPVAPNYVVPERWRADQQCAIGPQWRDTQGEWISLASLSEGLTHTLEVRAQSASEVSFSICWRLETRSVSVWEDYVLHAESLDYEARVEINGVPAEAVRLVVPLLDTDGEMTAETSLEKDQAMVSYRGARYEVRWPGGGSPFLGKPVANRNGVYRALYIQSSQQRTTHLQFRFPQSAGRAAAFR